MSKRPIASALSLALAGALILSACGGGDEEAAKVSAASNPLLELIPADTPYVIANLEPVPADIVDAYLQRMEPMLEQMQGSMLALRNALDEELDQNPESDAADAAVLDAIVAEFDGKLNREGLESLGMSLESISAIYGHGLFPVLRAGIGDAEKVRAMVARVESNSGQSVPPSEFQGISYWRFADSDSQMGLYLSILDDHVVMSAGPVSREAEFLPALLGLERPSNSIADSGALIELNEEKGFAAYGSGYVEFSRVLDEMFEADSTTAQWMGDLGQFDLSSVDPSCELEARIATTFVPRMVMGTTTITDDSVGIRYQLETNPLLGGQLAKLVSDVPVAAAGGNNMVNASMSLELGRVREFLLDSANAMAAVPFRCPQLEDVNVQVQQLAQALNQPMPPFVGNLKGFRAELSEVDPQNPDPANMRGLLSLEMESPQMVIGMASMMIPGFEDLQIEPGGDPVALPQDLMMVQTPDMELYAVMSNDAIGISLGKGSKDQLKPFMDQSSDPDGAFLSVEYDMAALAEMQTAGEDWSTGWDDGYDTDPQASGPGEELQDLMEAYEAFMGRSRLEMRFDGDGLTIDSLQTFP